jgi:chaperonin GroES
VNWTPVADRILARKTEIKSIRGIVIPATAKDQTIQAEVLGVGPDVKNTKVGDSILFGKYAGMEYTNESETLLLLRDEDIMAVSAEA